MRDLRQLLVDCRVQPRMPVPVQIAPQARDAVEILAAFAINQRAAMSRLNQQRLVLGHLREGMPDVGQIPAFQIVERLIVAAREFKVQSSRFKVEKSQALKQH